MLPAFLIALIACSDCDIRYGGQLPSSVLWWHWQILVKIVERLPVLWNVSIIGAFLFANLVEFMNVWLAGCDLGGDLLLFNPWKLFLRF